MAKIQLTQENMDISNAIRNLMAVSGTNLTKVCEKHDLDYPKTYKLINASKIDLDFVRAICTMINPDVKFQIRLDIDIRLNDQSIFNQISK